MGMASTFRPNTTARGPAIASGSIPSREIPLRPVAPNPTPIPYPVRLVRLTAYLRTIPLRTSCGRPDPAEGVDLVAVVRCVRHCRRDDAHGSPNAEPYAYVWHRYIRIVGRGQRQHVQQAAHRCYRWQPGPYTCSRGGIGRSFQYPPVLCALIYYAHRITNERA